MPRRTGAVETSCSARPAMRWSGTGPLIQIFQIGGPLCSGLASMRHARWSGESLKMGRSSARIGSLGSGERASPVPSGRSSTLQPAFCMCPHGPVSPRRGPSKSRSVNPAMISVGTIRSKEAFHVQSTEWIRHQEPEVNGSITMWCRLSSGPVRAIRGSPGVEVRVHPAASRAWVT